MSYQIEMLWTCSTCEHSGNKGLAKRCENCGKPKDDGDEEYFPDDISEANALTGDKLRQALAGPDWKCKYCLTLQNTLGKCCTNCGADQATGKQPWQHMGKTITEDVTTGRKTFSLTPKEEVEEKAPAPVIDASSSFFMKHFFVVFAGVMVFGLLLWALFHKSNVDAHVSALQWKQGMDVERYQVVHDDGWTPDAGAFEIVNEGPRVHHHDRVPVGSHQEPYSDSYQCGESCRTVSGSCYTTPRSCTSNGNGTASCSGGNRVCSPSYQSCSPKYCSRTLYRTVTDYQQVPRYQTWYSWKEWTWKYDRTVMHDGGTSNPTWPSEKELLPTRPLALGEKERTSRTSAYKVTFEDDDRETYDLSVPTAEEFKTFPVGRKVHLEVGLASGVRVLPEQAAQ